MSHEANVIYDEAVQEFIEEQAKRRHGGPADRGGADAYYQRAYRPHYYKEGTYSSEEITAESMTPEEIAEYSAGYSETKDSGAVKEWDVE